MSRISKTFEDAKKNSRPVFTAYLTIGFPTLAGSEEAASRLIDEGAGMVELGVPFSDPFADGGVIRSAAYKALENGVTLKDAIALASRLRAKHPGTPLVLFSYYNPIVSMGLERFADAAAAAGVDAVLAVDLPLEERDELLDVLRPRGIAIVPLIAPNTPQDRVKASAEGAGDSFLYAITVKGVTGKRDELPPELAGKLDEIRAVSPLPVVAGFGISSKAQGEAIVAGHADGYVIGSAIVKRLADGALGSADPII